jgi:GAF domain-containing protein/anti-sigma regulatory factor (Ser/Thr protein kinase)
VIGTSPGNPQPVFEAIARNAVLLCDAMWGGVFTFDGTLLHFVSGHGLSKDALRHLRDEYPIAPRGINRMAIMDRTAVHVVDALNDPRVANLELVRRLGYRRHVVVPMLQGGGAIGTIHVYGAEPKPFSAAQISLLGSFADQAVIAIENARLFESEQARTTELTAALEQQTATSEVLSVISNSPGELKPVFDATLKNAVRICDAKFGQLFLFDAEEFRVVATRDVPRAWAEFLERRPSIAADPKIPLGRVASTKQVVQIADITMEQGYIEGFPPLVAVANLGGARTLLVVPMLKESVLVGAIGIFRQEVRPFTSKQIEMVKSFASQAVIAIENTRLFGEVQARTRELCESLEQQTATSEVLQVISSSPGELEPVFEAMLSNAVRVSGAKFGAMHLYGGGAFRTVAMHNAPLAFVEMRQSTPIFRMGPGTALGRAVRSKQMVQFADLKAEQPYREGEPSSVMMVELAGARTLLVVPMLKEDEVVGTIAIYRQEVRPFTDKQVALVQNFASQAVIAIENTRLLNELRESLQQQTATADVLKVISRSAFDLRTVLETLTESAARLCEADQAGLAISREGGSAYSYAAVFGFPDDAGEYFKNTSFPPGRGSIVGRTLLAGCVVHVHDVEADPEYRMWEVQQRVGGRTLLGVPLTREGTQIGVVMLARRSVRPFADKQVELATTFADQAVIAIENTRLFEEVQARNRDLTALGEVGRAVSSTLDLNNVLKTIVDRAVNLSGADGGSIFYYRDEVGRFELGETTGLDEDVIGRFRKLDIAAGETGLGEAIAKRQPIQVPDITKRASNPLRDAALEAGLRAALIVPLLGAKGPLGALVLQRRQPGEFPEAVVSLMQSFADQSAIALENAHLFEEIAQKGRELEIASQHKSQFVANMSHELRTPLAAILGYAELMQEGFYEPLGEKSMDALTRIRSNGKHLLGLINTVLDIAKIESGQFSLNLGEYAIESVVETVRAATESLAETKKLSLRTAVAKQLPIGLGDEQRLTQVLLNLVGNAIKFTDTGEVRITATTENGQFTIAVADTGPGIPAKEQARIFEQFHQVDNSNTKAKGGTGLGLAIAKQIVEMHGGRIWVESTLGRGATFQLELPIRTENARPAP